MVVATAGMCVALFAVLSAGTAVAVAPYPPSGPCAVSATARGPAAADGTYDYDVMGSGLGPTQPVRVVLAATGQQVGAAQTDGNGNFRTVVTAPADADSTAPDITVSSPRRTCTSPPPAPPTSPGGPGQPTSAGSTGTASPPAGTGGGRAGNGSGNGTGTGSGGGAGSGGTSTTGPGSGAASGSPGRPGSSGTAGTTASGGATTSPGTGSTSTLPSVPALAEPLPGSDTPLGIGLGIAAVLLVLGTLAVLLLTRRPER